MLGKMHKMIKKIINTIYMKPCFPVIKKLSENCNVNAPLQFLLADYIDILMMSESKLDGIFPSSQFQICFRASYRLDRNDRGGGILLFVRENLITRLLSRHSPMILKYYL